MIEACNSRHEIVHRDPFAYCAHPHIVVTADDGWLVVFNRAPRREFVLHPPEEPLFRNVLIKSVDQGRSWSVPQVVPGYDFSGMECAGLTRLANGEILLNQWRFDWYPLGLARTLRDQFKLTYPDVFIRGWLNSPEHDVAAFARKAPEDLASWVRGGGRAFTHISTDNGAIFAHTVEVSTAPFSGGYGMRGAAQLSDGTIILPLSDIPNYRCIFAVKSQDDGRSWSAPSLIAAGEEHEFEEPAILCLKSDKLILIGRDNGTRYLHQTMSADGGRSWTAPTRLPIEGYPAQLLALKDDRLLLTYGWRQPDFGIRAVLSNDSGDSWDIANTIRIRGDLPNKNLGYPATIQSDRDEFFTIYYGEDATGCTCIMGTTWRL